PTRNVPPLSRLVVAMPEAVTLLRSKLFVPVESRALSWMVNITHLPGLPPPMLQTPSVTLALFMMVTLALRLPPEVSRPKAVAVPVALTTALEANWTVPRGTMKLWPPCSALPVKIRVPPSLPGRQEAPPPRLTTLPAQVPVLLLVPAIIKSEVELGMVKSFVMNAPLPMNTIPPL